MGSNPFPNQTVATVDSSTMAPYSSTSPRQQRRWRRLLRAFLLYSHCAVTCTVQSLHSAVTVQSLHSAVTVQSAVARLTIAQSLYSRCTATSLYTACTAQSLRLIARHYPTSPCQRRRQCRLKHASACHQTRAERQSPRQALPTRGAARRMRLHEN